MKGPALPAPRFATLLDALGAAARTEHGLIFVDAAEREERLPWSEVYARARATAAGLRELGVQPGDRVALLLRVRIRAEEAALGNTWAQAFQGRPRFVPEVHRG